MYNVLPRKGCWNVLNSTLCYCVDECSLLKNLSDKILHPLASIDFFKKNDILVAYVLIKISHISLQIDMHGLIVYSLIGFDWVASYKVLLQKADLSTI